MGREKKKLKKKSFTLKDNLYDFQTCDTKMALSRLIMVRFLIWKKFWKLKNKTEMQFFFFYRLLKSADRSLRHPRHQLTKA